jgi:DNA-binding HxlR family transcriptional regulator
LKHSIGNHLLHDHEDSDKGPSITTSEKAFIQAIADLLEDTGHILILWSKGQSYKQMNHLVRKILDLPQQTLHGRIHGENEWF